MTKTKTNKDKLKKLTSAQKRVAICKDVLKQLKFYRVRTGNYCKRYDTDDININNISDDAELQKYLPKLKNNCRVCALGAAMLSHVRLFNNYKARQAIDTSYGFEIGGDECYENLGKHFDEKQLILIESAFEGWSREGFDFFHFYYCNPTPKERLKLIMENIIKNNGTFEPTQLMAEHIPPEHQ